MLIYDLKMSLHQLTAIEMEWNVFLGMHSDVQTYSTFTHTAPLHNCSCNYTLDTSEPPSFLMLVTELLHSPDWLVSPTGGVWCPHMSFFIPSFFAVKSQNCLLYAADEDEYKISH